VDKGCPKRLNLRVRRDITGSTDSLDSFCDHLITADNQRTDGHIIRQDCLPRQFDTASDVMLVLNLIRH
jgi:hypothetical protein